jgi:hypothetical protein
MMTLYLVWLVCNTWYWCGGCAMMSLELVWLVRSDGPVYLVWWVCCDGPVPGVVGVL